MSNLILIDEDTVKQALEALIAATPVKAKDPQMQAAAIVALREALAEQPAPQPEQPEQELVAWGVFDGPNLHDMFFTEQDAQDMARLKGDGSVVKPLCTTTPKRQWAGLTVEEMNEMTWGKTIYEILELAEAKLKEKNT